MIKRTPPMEPVVAADTAESAPADPFGTASLHAKLAAAIKPDAPGAKENAEAYEIWRKFTNTENTVSELTKAAKAAGIHLTFKYTDSLISKKDNAMLPSGYLVTARPMHTKLAEALYQGLSGLVADPDIQHIHGAVWINQGTLERVSVRRDELSAGDAQAEAQMEQFRATFATGLQSVLSTGKRGR